MYQISFTIYYLLLFLSFLLLLLFYLYPLFFFLFFFKQNTAYEMRISDWSSDVCSSGSCAAAMRSCPNLHHIKRSPVALPNGAAPPLREHDKLPQIFHHITKYHHLKMVNQFTNDLWRRHRPDAQGSMMG